MHIRREKLHGGNKEEATKNIYLYFLILYSLSPVDQAPFKILLIKAERFCAYQERCSHEIKQKMKELGADGKETEKIISSLQEDDFLNDERFAKLFTSGKFRIKRWGKNKIRAELRIKKIPEDLISNALNGIDKEEYKKTIQHLINKKSREVKSKKLVVSGAEPSKDKTRKIGMFLLSRGFESELIWKVLKNSSDG